MCLLPPGSCRESVDKVDFARWPFRVWSAERPEEPPVEAETVIVATGATAKRMDIPGDREYWQRGISACAVCDGKASATATADP